MAHWEDKPMPAEKQARIPLSERVSVLEKRLSVAEESLDAMRRQHEWMQKTLSAELGI